MRKVVGMKNAIRSREPLPLHWNKALVGSRKIRPQAQIPTAATVCYATRKKMPTGVPLQVGTPARINNYYN
ncbi:MAG: hypothetical protein KDN22_11605 [Verrucomicrobiae bacterium]|nr:hypothetical protein [Verrucomicrobiae bacterium]